MLIAGISLNKLVIGYGSFVNKAIEQIIQTLKDYHNRRISSIDF
ncbi:hypothetical protein JYQ62_11480 [Nostoc sp. UHCC 0702]|nr:hypothetical protein JYQ62_11480 [Nostoc sp. UHCC 0702]